MSNTQHDAAGCNPSSRNCARRCARSKRRRPTRRALRAQFRDAAAARAKRPRLRRGTAARWRLPLAAAAVVVLAVGAAIAAVAAARRAPACRRRLRPRHLAAGAAADQRISAVAELAGLVAVVVVQRRARAHSAVGVRRRAGHGARRQVEADLLVGEDGLARAIRFNEADALLVSARRTMMRRIAMSSKTHVAFLLVAACGIVRRGCDARSRRTPACRRRRKTRCSSCRTSRRCAAFGATNRHPAQRRGVPGPVVKGKPYSARSITESTQMLGGRQPHRAAQRSGDLSRFRRPHAARADAPRRRSVAGRRAGHDDQHPRSGCGQELRARSRPRESRARSGRSRWRSPSAEQIEAGQGAVDAGDHGGPRRLHGGGAGRRCPVPRRRSRRRHRDPQ